MKSVSSPDSNQINSTHEFIPDVTVVAAVAQLDVVSLLLLLVVVECGGGERAHEAEAYREEDEAVDEAEEDDHGEHLQQLGGGS